MHRYSILAKPLILVALTELRKIHVLKGTNSKSNMLYRYRCSTDEGSSLSRGILRIINLSLSVKVEYHAYLTYFISHVSCTHNG